MYTELPTPKEQSKKAMEFTEDTFPEAQITNEHELDVIILTLAKKKKQESRQQLKVVCS